MDRAADRQLGKAADVDRLASWRTSTGELTDLFAALDHEAYTGLAQWFDQLTESNRIFFTGQGRSGLAARMVAMRFMHMDLESYVVGEATAPSITGGDLLLAISGSGRTPVTLNFAEVATGVGASVALVTHQSASPIREVADTSLVLPTAGTQQFGGTLFEEAALLVLDALVFDQMTQRGTPHELMARRHTNFL